MSLGNDEFLTIVQLAPLVRQRKLSPVELTRFIIERIELCQPRLNAFITIAADQALAQARRAEKEISGGVYHGPLHGIPISCKDIFYTHGIRTTAGSKILRDFVPDRNAEAVDLLLKSGAILVGKTNLHEFAFGVTNVNPHYGPVRNPWDQTRIAGGSSGGSAVSVAAGLAVASLGTDTGGSIRIPAAACGCVGIKPTFGLISLSGVIPLSFSLDHVGPICRCVEDAGLMLAALLEESRAASSFGENWYSKFTKELREGIKGLRIGIPREYFFDRLQSEVRRSVCQALKKLEACGAQIRRLHLKGLEETADLASDITVAEALAFHWRWLNRNGNQYGSDVRNRLRAGKTLPAVRYLTAQEKRRFYSRAFNLAFESVDALAVPTLPVTAPKIGEREVVIGGRREDARLALLSLTRPANLAGLPAISVPCGFSSEGLPIGIQFIGPKLGEATILRLAYEYECSTDWHRRFPQVMKEAAVSDSSGETDKGRCNPWKNDVSPPSHRL